MSESGLETKQRQLDTILNKTFLDLGAYSIAGYGAGIVVGLFFTRGRIIRNALAGVGGSYGFVINKGNFNAIA